MKLADKKSLTVGIALLILAGFFIILPYIFIGPPLPLFTVYNEDNINHTVIIEMIDSNNKVIFENKYELSHQDKITESKNLWLLLKLSLPFTNDNYMIKATLENDTSGMITVRLNPWTKISVSIVDSSIFIDTMVV